MDYEVVKTLKHIKSYLWNLKESYNHLVALLEDDKIDFDTDGVRNNLSEIMKPFSEQLKTQLNFIESTI